MPPQLPRVVRGPAIYDHVRACLDDEGRLRDDAPPLPDDPPRDDNTITWAPGALDGVVGGAGDDEASAAEAARRLVKAARRPTRRALAKLYDALRDEGTLSYLDPMIDRVVESGSDVGAVHELGVWLATTGAHRGPVKVGVALIGVTGLREAARVVHTLGAHDEFTLYAAVALRNGADAPDRELWQLAQKVEGWGRIQCVERLRDTTDPEIREWILREGFRNSVMYEYLAYIAATTGGLLDALRRPQVDRELLTAAGEIIDALINGGPAEDIDDVEDAPLLLDAYLDLLATRAETLTDLWSTTLIDGFVTDEHTVKHWDEVDCSRIRRKAQTVLRLPHWPDVVASGLASEDRKDFWLASQVAPTLGIDTFEVHWDRLLTDPLDGPWWEAWRRADSPERREKLVEHARASIPTEAIATGPGDSLGFGPEYRAHRALDWSLQELRHHPGLGADLVALALRSPVTRNRNLALNALKEWPVADWPDGVAASLRGIAESDPNEQTRDLARDALGRTSSP